ncbi:hypothetical protein ACTS9V_06705 [Empedobacter falsenii]
MNYELNLEEGKDLVITPQLNEIFVWFEEDQQKVFIKDQQLNHLIFVAKSIIGIE